MATDLERLIVSIEANTKQFERAMRSLEGTTDRAMRGVETSIVASQKRQESLFAYYGHRGGEQFAKEFAKGFGIGREGLAGLAGLLLAGFIRDSVKVAADAGSQSAQVFLKQWDGVAQGLKTVVGGALADIFLAMQRGFTQMGIPGGQLIEDQATIADTEARRLEIEQRRTTVLTKNVQLTQQETNLLDKQDKLGYKEPARVAAPRLGALQAPGAEQLADFDKVMKNLIFEEQQLGRSAEEQRVYNELKKAGVNIESEFGQAIALTARRLHEEELTLQAVKEVNDGLQESTKTFVQGLIDGQSAAEAFSAAIRKMADALLDLALHSLFNPGGTPLLQQLFGGALGLGGFTGGVLPGTGNQSLGASRAGSGASGTQFNTAINVSGSVDQKTLAAMSGMIQRNNARQNAELQRQWGNHAARYSSLRGP